MISSSQRDVTAAATSGAWINRRIRNQEISYGDLSKAEELDDVSGEADGTSQSYRLDEVATERPAPIATVPSAKDVLRPSARDTGFANSGRSRSFAASSSRSLSASERSQHRNRKPPPLTRANSIQPTHSNPPPFASQNSMRPLEKSRRDTLSKAASLRVASRERVNQIKPLRSCLRQPSSNSLNNSYNTDTAPSTETRSPKTVLSEGGPTAPPRPTIRPADDFTSRPLPKRRSSHVIGSNKPKSQGEFYRSYNFDDDPKASFPKIRRRGDTTDSNFDDQSSQRSLGTRSMSTRSIFSTASAAGSVGAATTATAVTACSHQSTRSAPPNYWELDRKKSAPSSPSGRSVGTHYTHNTVSNDVDIHNLLKTYEGRSVGGDFTDSDTESFMSSDWKNVSKGVPPHISTSLKRLALRDQMRGLKQLLNDPTDAQKIMMLQRKKSKKKRVPPTPPLLKDGTAEEMLLEDSGYAKLFEDEDASNDNGSSPKAEKKKKKKKDKEKKKKKSSEKKAKKKKKSSENDKLARHL